MAVHAQWHQLYDQVTFYVVAHQDDWQLFMGTNVYNDIVSYNEKNPLQNGKKVVLIYTTSGNLNDSDDSRSCMCKDPYNSYAGHLPYWKAREAGAKHSTHLAACRMGGWGPGAPYPVNQTVVINGHPITKYSFKNTTSYFLRTKTGMYSQWKTNPQVAVGTVDSSTTYTDWNDLVNTLYYIYKAEMDSSVVNGQASFNFQDMNEDINPNDHNDHLIAGRSGCEAAKLLGKEVSKCFPMSLFVDYHSQNLPENLSTPDVQNESALTGVYCLALLDYNAWPEWGTLYTQWASRNYFRTITTCENPTTTNILAQDSLVNLSVKAFPNPANENLFLRFNLPTQSLININVVNTMGATVLSTNTHLSADNTLSVNTSGLAAGAYMVTVGTDGNRLSSIVFEVQH